MCALAHAHAPLGRADRIRIPYTQMIPAPFGGRDHLSKLYTKDAYYSLFFFTVVANEISANSSFGR